MATFEILHDDSRYSVLEYILSEITMYMQAGKCPVFCFATNRAVVGNNKQQQVRQYFTDSTYYANDAGTRGQCGQSLTETAAAATSNDGKFSCDAFSPSSATVKVM